MCAAVVMSGSSGLERATLAPVLASRSARRSTAVRMTAAVGTSGCASRTRTRKFSSFSLRMCGGRAEEAADIGAELERHVAGGQRRRRAAGGASGRAAEVPWVVRRAVDVVVALPVGQRDGHVGLAQHDGASGLGARDDQSILCWPPVLAAREAPGGRQSRDVEGLL